MYFCVKYHVPTVVVKEGKLVVEIRQFMSFIDKNDISSELQHFSDTMRTYVHSPIIDSVTICKDKLTNW